MRKREIKEKKVGDKVDVQYHHMIFRGVIMNFINGFYTVQSESGKTYSLIIEQDFINKHKYINLI